MPGGATRSRRRLGLLGLVVMGGAVMVGPSWAAGPIATDRPGDWTGWRKDTHNTAAARLPASPTGQAQGWTFRPDGIVRPYRPGMSVWSSPALGEVDGRAVLAIGSYDRNVYLVDPASGTRVWRFTTGAGVYATPLIWRDGQRWWVFAASSDRAIYGLDGQDGRRVWSHAVAPYLPTTGGAQLSSPCLGEVGGKPALFVGHWVYDKSLAHSTQEGGLTAVDARTGKRLWQTSFLDNRVSAPVWTRVDGRGLVVVASRDGNLRALDAQTGKILWSHRETEPIAASPLVVETRSGTRVFIGSHFGKLRCLEALTGREVWSFKAGHWITGTAAFARAAGRDLIVFGAYNQRIYALDPETGQRVWTQSAAGPVHGSAAILARSGQALAVLPAWDHHLYGVALEDGTLLWRVFVGAPLWDGIVQGESTWASPALAKLGDTWMIVHGSTDGVLYGIPVSMAAQAGGSPPWTGLRFWVTMLVVMGLTALVAVWLTRRHRRRIGPRST